MEAVAYCRGRLCHYGKTYGLSATTSSPISAAAPASSRGATACATTACVHAYQGHG